MLVNYGYELPILFQLYVHQQVQIQSGIFKIMEIITWNSYVHKDAVQFIKDVCIQKKIDLSVNKNLSCEEIEVLFILKNRVL